MPYEGRDIKIITDTINSLCEALDGIDSNCVLHKTIECTIEKLLLEIENELVEPKE